MKALLCWLTLLVVIIEVVFSTTEHNKKQDASKLKVDIPLSSEVIENKIHELDRKVTRLLEKEHSTHSCHDLRLRLAKAEEAVRFYDEMRVLREELNRFKVSEGACSVTPKCRRTIEDLGMVSIEYSHYYFSNESNKMSWPNAQQFCRSYGLQLASVETNSENEQLDLYLLYSLGVGEHPAAYWLSATDAGHGGRFVWSGTGQSMIFSAWHVDMPKPPGFYGGRHRCVSTHLLDKKALSWGTFNCGEKRYFICEMIQPCQ